MPQSGAARGARAAAAGPAGRAPGRSRADGERPDSGSFIVARNPDPGSRLPYLLRLPVAGERPLALATAGTWPGPKDLFCYQLEVWPDGAEVVETVAVERCWRGGAAVHLVLRRRQRRRSLFVWTASRGRPLIFWRSQTSMRGARPGIRVPQARGLERALAVAVDVQERRPWRFSHHEVQTERRQLPVGDYGVLRDGRCVAAVERKSVADLAGSATGGGLGLVLAELERLPHSALVVEGRLSDLLKGGTRAGVRPGWLLNLVAALQVAHPRVTWMFAETRALAEDYAYRWLAASAHAERGAGAGQPGPEPEAAAAAPDSGRAVHAAWAVREAEVRYPGPEVLDAAARRQIALDGAAAGVAWTTAALAARCGVTPATAWKDLRALAREGRLVAEGGRRLRRYRAPGAANPPGGPSATTSPDPGAAPGPDAS